MHWLAICFVWLQNKSECSPTEIGQRIPLFLSFPVFKNSHLVFKFTYFLNQLRLRLLCSQDLFLKFYNCCIATGGVIDVL